MVNGHPFPSVPEQISLEQGSLKDDCAPWVPATHPDGALYFFDEERVRHGPYKYRAVTHR
jgi:hypothetical protein